MLFSCQMRKLVLVEARVDYSYFLFDYFLLSLSNFWPNLNARFSERRMTRERNRQTDEPTDGQLNIQTDGLTNGVEETVEKMDGQIDIWLSRRDSGKDG